MDRRFKYDIYSKTMINKILIIGSGITGITLAERFASNGNKVLIIEKRNHIGGNCYNGPQNLDNRLSSPYNIIR